MVLVPMIAILQTPEYNDVNVKQFLFCFRMYLFANISRKFVTFVFCFSFAHS
jgi:hypothetical protein